MTTFATVLLTAAALIAPPSTAAVITADETPRDVIDQCVQQVLETMQDDALSLEGKRQRVEALVDERLDVPSLAKFSLGRHYKTFSAEQRAAFEQEFQQHLINTYWNQAESAKLANAEILSDREEKRGDWTVKTRVKTPSTELSIDYRMRKRGDRWLIIDIFIERVSLVVNFRDQFNELLARQSADDLIQTLRDKNGRALAARHATAGGDVGEG